MVLPAAAGAPGDRAVAGASVAVVEEGAGAGLRWPGRARGTQDRCRAGRQGRVVAPADQGRRRADFSPLL